MSFQTFRADLGGSFEFKAVRSREIQRKDRHERNDTTDLVKRERTRFRNGGSRGVQRVYGPLGGDGSREVPFRQMDYRTSPHNLQRSAPAHCWVHTAPGQAMLAKVLWS